MASRRVVDVWRERAESRGNVTCGGRVVVIGQALGAVFRRREREGEEAHEGEVVKKAIPFDWARRKRRRVREGAVVAGGRRENAGGIATGGEGGVWAGLEWFDNVVDWGGGCSKIVEFLLGRIS